MVNLISAFLSHFAASCMNLDVESETITMKSEAAAKFEFAVNMTCHSCEKAVRESLGQHKGIESIAIDIPKQSVLVSTTLPSNVIQDAIEQTGMIAALKGQGTGDQNLGAAVSILKDNGVIKGLVRFVQIEKEKCVIDGSFNGLTPGKHALHVHELGDLSDGCSSTGGDYNPNNSRHGDRTNKNRHVGDLGNIEVDEKGAAMLRYEDDLINVWDIIGRSVVIHENEDDFTDVGHGNAGKGIACGIIARSSGLFQNEKKVCTCSGKTLWEEREDFRREQQST